MLYDNTYSPEDRSILLNQLLQERQNMLKEMNSLKEAGLYADSIRDSIDENSVIKNIENMSCKLNYLAYFPRVILRKALEDNLDKEELRYLFVIIGEVNSKGIINNITRYQLIQIIKAKYGEDNCNSSTYYKVHQNLVDLGYIRYENNSILLCDYAASFSKKDEKSKLLGSVVLPSFIYTYTLKNMSITAYRLMLEWMDLIGGIKSKKYIHYKLTSDVCQRMKKRCAEEVRPAINELSFFFDIREEISSIDGLSVYHVSLKDSYITDEKALAGIKQPAYIKHGYAFRNITKLLKNYGVMDLLQERKYKHMSEEYEDLEIYDAVSTITKLLAKYLGNPVKKILSILKNNILNIKSIGGFLTNLIEIYILNKSYGELELKQLKKLIERFIEYGYSLDDIKDISPSMYERYQYLSLEAAITT